MTNFLKGLAPVAALVVAALVFYLVNQYVQTAATSPSARPAGTARQTTGAGMPFEVGEEYRVLSQPATVGVVGEEARVATPR